MKSLFRPCRSLTKHVNTRLNVETRRVYNRQLSHSYPQNSASTRAFSSSSRLRYNYPNHDPPSRFSPRTYFLGGVIFISSVGLSFFLGTLYPSRKPPNIDLTPESISRIATCIADQTVSEVELVFRERTQIIITEENGGDGVDHPEWAGRFGVDVGRDDGPRVTGFDVYFEHGGREGIAFGQRVPITKVRLEFLRGGVFDWDCRTVRGVQVDYDDGTSEWVEAKGANLVYVMKGGENLAVRRRPVDIENEVS